ncbi:MAG: hypothetical protein A2W99_02140 [Bacteroidetes bacterium GWF2_33_16]|nr:MAG: hypothetical protein A2X00_16015 [Bacteroidetes bacterium GWE2_32_14]OFY07066.1 MAG: hypothetical protein A2W99_02140 [Bacteroidetes bacterium GWF2_33_16]
MKSKFTMALFIFIVFILIIDIYTFTGIRILASTIESTYFKSAIYISYWLVPIILVIGSLYIMSQTPFIRDTKIFKLLYLFIGVFLLFYIPKLLFLTFHFFDDSVLIIKWLIHKMGFINNFIRIKAISQAGLILSIIPFLLLFYGMVIGRFDFKVTQQDIAFSNLPDAFNGLKIIHISDIHIGSFYGNEKKFKKAIDLINKQKPDLILFTGDLVNNFAEEVDGFIPILSNLKAKYGKYSILGNHDYGDYFNWKDSTEKAENLNKLILAHEKMGFRLLINESEILQMDQSEIVIIGIENWGLPPFVQHGDLKKAMNGIKNNPFKILLSHDPSHWDSEVIGQTNIDLTLSGHTHGMQFGIDIGKFKWSPVKYKYPRWSGLYKELDQFLYVNRGLGYIAYPGRVGMPPEITVINLYKK